MELTKQEIAEIIENTVNMTVIKLKMSGQMKDTRKTAFEKTEELLYNYQTFKNITDQPYTMKITNIIEDALKSIENDIYFDIIRLIYFENHPREYVADHFNTSVTTISRNKTRLVNLLKVKLFSDDVIYELFL